jgi:hypothetical protein
MSATNCCIRAKLIQASRSSAKYVGNFARRKPESTGAPIACNVFT